MVGPPAIGFNRDVPPELERIITKALEKDRIPRYQHASEVRYEADLLEEEGVAAHFCI